MSAPFVSLSCSKAAREALKGTKQVDIDHRLEAVGRQLLRRRQEVARRAADQHVHGSKLGAAASEGRVQGGDVAHVGGHRTDLGAESTQLRRCRIELFLGAAADGNAGTQGGEVLRHAKIDAAAAAGDEYGLASVESFREILSYQHGFLLFSWARASHQRRRSRAGGAVPMTGRERTIKEDR